MMADSTPPRPRISRAWLLILVVLAVLVLGDLNRRMANARRLERDAVSLQTQVSGLQVQNADLQTSVAGATSEASVAEWARGEAGLVRPGEHLIIPVPAPGQTPVPTPTTVNQAPTPSHWAIWWALLFGS